MEDFLGTWNLVKSTKYDEYLKAFDVVQDLNNDVITESFCKEGGHVVWKIGTIKQTGVVMFNLNEEFSIVTPDGRQCLITMSLKNNKLIQVQKMGNKVSTVICEIQGANMIMTLKCNGVEAQRIYEQVAVPVTTGTTNKCFLPLQTPVQGCTIQ